ncbi:hypothetical protein [Salinibacterium sp. ZJ77]|uniref:hypothetical protein n=1 Tax=Salinibacterium sp. ZJ77 TaxID=2708337 RepID=UPI00142326ED|nr:hypothetical protein [Salinibacterium sp. ZJ77]
MTDIRTELARIAAQLSDAHVSTEARVDIVKRRFRGERMRVVGEVWRLGAVCLDASGALFATGEVLAVKKPTHPNHRSAMALRRNELFLLAQKSGITAGATIVVDAHPLDLGEPTAPLVGEGDQLSVQWMRGAEPTPLLAYVRERAELLMHPLPGATD